MHTWLTWSEFVGVLAWSTGLCSDNCLWWCAVVRIILGKQPLDCDPVKLFSSDCMHWDWRLNLSLSFLLSLWFKWGTKVYSSITFNRTVLFSHLSVTTHIIIMCIYIMFFFAFLDGGKFHDDNDDSFKILFINSLKISRISKSLSSISLPITVPSPKSTFLISQFRATITNQCPVLCMNGLREEIFSRILSWII